MDPLIQGSLAFGIAFLGLIVYRHFHRPYDFRREPSVPRLSRGQKPAEFPPPFPNGWYMLCRSADLSCGEVRQFDVLGQHMVLVRNFEGAVGALEAWCPHLGAHLAVGGYINPSTNCLRCPFHGWEFDVLGVCTSIDGTDTIPAGSNIRPFPAREVNDCILVWFHVEGEAPQWEPEAYKAIESGNWYFAGRTVALVHAHIQEIPENGADAAHLNVLHKNFVWDKIAPTVTHKWAAAWSQHPNYKHRSSIELHQTFQVFGVKIPGSNVDAVIEQQGPGIVRLELSTPLGKLVAYENVTPAKTTSQLVQHVMYCSPTIPRCLGRFFLWAMETQFSRDIPIWEQKKFLPKPKISKADGPILAFRRWYSQFYSPSSCAFSEAFAKENMLDW